MVVKTATEYINDTLSDRVKYLQDALNQAELIIHKLELENENLKSILVHIEQEALVEA